ncbi:murein L,D-transpeptidase YafK [Ancylobacter aquaticus]|uniref:Murein L,D-transpeptidase YafK n=1 Tax=Ancylobacter aquaticus TaxID=100 RepID=A0A4R1HPD8_ANCAQ|nr:murein L,D-transpeptidase family protein [Ancylobacter aquaticus]TCK23081.1 murein L,D-transpeptidase YafK [Ancylobacter aquaticus]
MRFHGLSSLSRQARDRGLGAPWRAALLAGCTALVLAGCNGGDSNSPMSKASRTLSPKTLALIQEKDMTKSSPIVVRIFKEESELEVWKETAGGDYALLKTYPICRWSGELGPKVKEGDRQAPEGFYTITPGQMNPNSSYYLAFDLGFPNAYDRAWGRSGSNLMVHGDCSSRGCYAMTDEQVQEIFALGRESFFGGQRSFQVQAYPFRMTTDNLVRHRNNPHLAFWKMLKQGSDVFELTKAPPKVDYCGKRYVFNATPTDPGQKLQASAPCPDYTLPEGLEEALAARQKDVSTKIASAGTLQPAAPVKTGKDGGMHKVFLAKLENPELSAPGSLPPVVKPPGVDYGVSTTEPAPAESIALANADTVSETVNVPLPAARPDDAPGGPRTAIAAAPASGGFFDNLFSGLSPAPATPAPAEAAASTTSAGAAPNMVLLPPQAGDAPAATAGTPARPPERAALPQLASLDAGSNGGFLDSLKNWFGGSPPPAAAPAEPIADVPMPPARPPVPRQATAAPAAQPARVSRPAAAAPTAASSSVGSPSVASSGSEALPGAVPTLPGAAGILAPGSFSTVQ